MAIFVQLNSIFMRYLFLLITLSLWACTSNPYKVETFKDDPIQTQVYTLKNGLKLYMSVNPAAPRIFTSIAVRTGSKNDPADATGLAHYLEHLLFKGTDQYGTLNYEAEKPHLDTITVLYERYRSTQDAVLRKKIYHEIDSVSQLAAQYAIPNEYDRMMAELGASGTNAFTWYEQTVYINDIPSNQLGRWMAFEAERFRKPVFRLFHTELEAVYEEKNISLDSDEEKVYDTLMAALFRNHNYGLQTTIGTVAHLKNPSIVKIQEYFDTYYVANNMAVILTGDFVPDSAIVWAEKYFSGWRTGEVPKYTFQPEEPVVSNANNPILITGPEEESVVIGFRLGGLHTDEPAKMELADMLVNNGTAGIIDLDLIQGQKVLTASSYGMFLRDYSIWMLSGTPKEGQTLEEVRDALLGTVEKLKKGDFPDWLPEAALKHMNLDFRNALESNYGRNDLLQEVFINELDYSKFVHRYKGLAGLSKQDIVSFLAATLSEPIVVFKRMGERQESVQVEKPQITAIPIQRDTMSAFLQTMMAIKAPEIAPVFVDFSKEVAEQNLQPGISIYHHSNKENDRFELSYVWEWGQWTDPTLTLAMDYLSYVGTNEYNPREMKEAFYKTGCSFSTTVSSERVVVRLSGLQPDFEEGVKLLEHLMDQAQPNPEALPNLISDVLKSRQNDRTNSGSLLWGGLFNHAKYGTSNPYLAVLSPEALRSLTPALLVDKVKGLKAYPHRILYYGPEAIEPLASQLQKVHVVPSTQVQPPAKVDFAELPTTPGVYFVHYEMQQAEVIFMRKGVPFSMQILPTIQLFNEYFGGGMSSVVFQEIRESKAYAYSAYAGYGTPNRPNRHFYLTAYLGTQADKMPEATSAMKGLLDDMPQSPKNLEVCKNNILENIRTQRIIRGQVLWSYIQHQDLGFTEDRRKMVFEQLPALSMQDLQAFHAQYIRPSELSVCIVGDRRKLNLSALAGFGPIRELKVEDIMPGI